MLTKAEEIELIRLLEEEEREQETERNCMSIVGGGYNEFWNNKNRYRILKGGRGSKKSTTTALWFIWHIMKYNKANAVCVRKTFNTHKDSTFAQLKWAALKLGVYDKWEFKVSPLEAIYKPTGQKILFRGFDDPLKLTSMTVDIGELCWVWLEEAFEIDSVEDFDTFDESIRGEMPKGLWKQITITYNPWINSHWTKTRYWDNQYPDTFRLTTTHKCNEYLDEMDHKRIEDLQITNPDRYKVVGLGEYGLPGGTYFDEFREDIHVIKPFVIPETWTRYRSIDYGLDKLAVLWYALDPQNNVYVYKELHESDKIISEASARIKAVNGSDIIRQTYAPTDLQSRNKVDGTTIYETFHKNGVQFNFVSNKRIAGWLAVKEAINVMDSKDVHTGEIIKTTKLKIFNNCLKLIEYLPMVIKDESDPNDVATEPHELTHIVDSLRYFCITRFGKHEEEVKEKPQRDNFIDEMGVW
jgi:phage terminase large subunit